MVIVVRCRSYVCTVHHSQCIDGVSPGGTVVDGVLLFLTPDVLWYWETHTVFPCHLCSTDRTSSLALRVTVK